jgi:heme-degrading monooxygenase HmoA
MLIRIVRMTFQEGKMDQFHTIFDNSKYHIRSFPGNHHLELLRDPDHPNVRITYSLWESADALEAYRRSDLFRQTWAATKLLFSERAQAFSAEQLEIIN